MSSPATTSAPPTTRIGSQKFWSRRKLFIFLISAAVLICLATIFYVKYWPFSREAVLQDLKEASDSTVTAQSYHPTYFPPGCVLYGLEFHHGSNHFKLIEIQKLRVRGSYLGILRRHVPQIIAEGAHIFIPAGETSFHTQHSQTVVDELVANGSFVEFESKEAHERPFRFDVHEATLRDLRWDKAINYHLKFHNPNPPSEISANGKFGPWSTGKAEATPLSGAYTFEHADLGVYHGIGGILSSRGSFDGQLHHITVSGSTDTPDFHVKSSNNKVKLTTNFDAYVDGRNGDTFLKSVEAHFGNTSLLAEGSIAAVEGHKGKVTRLQISSRRARIEDVLGLFTENRAPMSGQTALTTSVEIPSGHQPFLHRLKLEGKFGIDQGSFTKPETQNNVNELSAGARGQNKNKKEDPPPVMTDLRGSVNLVDAIAHFHEISFGIPGAKARMHGTYSIEEPYRINLHGDMRVETRISKTTSGMKSFLLKVIDPIFKKKKKGEVVPVHVLGTYDKPDFGLDLGNKRDPNKQDSNKQDTKR
jgi:hypothetical protein